MSETIIGIDPGSDGGFAVFHEGLLANVVSFKFESTPYKVLHDFCKLFGGSVYLENVHSMPGQGVATSFEFGKNLGKIEGVLEVCGVTPKLITPQLWQALLKLPKNYELEGKEKRRRQARKDQEALARKLFPHIFQNWKASKQGDVFAAALIGYAGGLRVPATMVDEIIHGWRGLL